MANLQENIERAISDFDTIKRLLKKMVLMCLMEQLRNHTESL